MNARRGGPWLRYDFLVGQWRPSQVRRNIYAVHEHGMKGEGGGIYSVSMLRDIPLGESDNFS